MTILSRYYCLKMSVGSVWLREHEMTYTFSLDRIDSVVVNLHCKLLHF